MMERALSASRISKGEFRSALRSKGIPWCGRLCSGTTALTELGLARTRAPSYRPWSRTIRSLWNSSRASRWASSKAESIGGG